MYKDGYKNIVNIDYSKTVIDNMKIRCVDMPEMTCKIHTLKKHHFFLNIIIGLEMDIRDLKFDNESFDAIIDKGKTLEPTINAYILLLYRYNGRFNV